MTGVAVCPAVPMASFEDCETWLALLREVSAETKSNEPKTLAYLWLRGSLEGKESMEPQFMVGGLELYADEDALVVVHRDGVNYKRMRDTLATTGIVKYPKGGIVLRTPTSIGFLSRSLDLENMDENSCFATEEFSTPTPESRDYLLAELQQLAQLAQSETQVLSFLVFQPKPPAEPATLNVFARYSAKMDRSETSLRMLDLMKAFKNSGGSAKSISWLPTDFGFVRGGFSREQEPIAGQGISTPLEKQ
ncbi:hypothetical protein BJ170DRAFT_691152 [Xylariales sp. AK1849]|nr:hypothetical protein BJ170DRAFT_691152 [Xylariales sp. AK1849]